MLLYIVHQKLSMCIENLYVGFQILLKTFSSHLELLGPTIISTDGI